MFNSLYAGGEDHFRQRLDSINKEMQAIIERTAVERDRLYRNSAMMSLPWSIANGDQLERTDHHMSLFPASSPSSAIPVPFTSHGPLDESFVKRTVVDEMNSWKVVFQQMLSDAIKDVNMTIKQRLEEVNKMSLGFAESLRETTEASKRGLDEMQSAFNQLQRDAKRPVEEVSRQLEEHVKKITSEQTHLRDAVAALQNEARIEQQRGDRRVDELVRRHHNLVRNSLLELDAHVDGLRDELEGAMRTQLRHMSQECDDVQQQVARLQGALEATSDTTVRWVSELKNLMEESMTCRSEVRLCRQDFNRLEIIVQGLSAGGGDVGAASSLVKDELPQSAAAERPSPLVEVPRVEFLALRERVDSAQARVEMMERHMAAMGGALKRLSYPAGGGPLSRDASYSDRGTQRPGALDVENFATGESVQSSSSMSPMNFRGRHSHHHYHQQQHSHHQFLLQKNEQYHPEQQQQQTMPMRGQLGTGVMMRAVGDSRGRGGSQQSYSTCSPMSVQSREGIHPNNNFVRVQHHQQQQQQSCVQTELDESNKTQLPSHYSRPAPFRGGKEYVMGSTLPSSAQITGSATGMQQLQQQPHESPCSPGTTERGENSKMASSSAHEPQNAEKTPTPSDSYVSTDDGEEKETGRSMQYVPAPSSDVESEIDNKKMARLALD